MKEWMTALALLLALGGKAMSYEVEGNPDRKISFGFNYDRTKQDSQYTYRYYSGYTRTDLNKGTGNTFSLDARIPLTSLFTFSLRGGLLSSKNEFSYGQTVEYNGFDVGAGIRLFLP